MSTQHDQASTRTPTSPSRSINFRVGVFNRHIEERLASFPLSSSRLALDTANNNNITTTINKNESVTVLLFVGIVATALAVVFFPPQGPVKGESAYSLCAPLLLGVAVP